MWYDDIQWSHALFKDYIRDFIKIKTESGGWPKDCVSDAEKQAFLDKYWKEIEVQLSRDGLDCVNEGMRTIGKLFLNSVNLSNNPKNREKTEISSFSREKTQISAVSSPKTSLNFAFRCGAGGACVMGSRSTRS